MKPQPPEFEVSPPIKVTIDQAVHTVVYGPYYSPKRKDDLFPYAHDAGSKFYNQNYEFYLASNSRIMNPLHGPKLSDNGGTHTDYMNKQRTSQKGAGTIMRQLLGTLCGEQLDIQTPESFEELDELLQQYGVYLSSSALPSTLMLRFAACHVGICFRFMLCASCLKCRCSVSRTSDGSTVDHSILSSSCALVWCLPAYLAVQVMSGFCLPSSSQVQACQAEPQLKQ